MSDFIRHFTNLPPEQQAIRAKCFHPTGHFIEFAKEEIELSIPQRFEQLVAKHPDRVAVKTNHHDLSYESLNQAANRIARAILARLGEGEETVGLLFELGESIIAAIFGILKAGKIYVSFDLSFPSTRTADLMEDSRTKLLLTNTKNLSQARQLVQRGQDVLNCDDIDSSIDSGNLDLPISSQTPALLLYTSGSTATPKGVLHNHRNILVETRNYTNDVRICPEDRLALWHSCSSANSIRNMFGALLNGAALFPYDLGTDGFAPLVEWMRTNRITILHTVPTTFRRFLDTVAADATFPSLRILRLGGEPSNREDGRSKHPLGLGWWPSRYWPIAHSRKTRSPINGVFWGTDY